MALTGDPMVETSADTQPSVSLVIPCRAEYVSLCRLVAGALGARESLDEETIADVKVVVTEAFNCFLGPECERVAGLSGAQPEGQAPSLRLDFAVSPEEWTIVMSNPDRGRRISQSSVCDPMSEGGLGLTIIEALVDSMERTDNDADGSVFRLVKKVSSSAVDSE
jgi:anti-sigma regulatory factor (Ser/Thr protein kinase)